MIVRQDTNEVLVFDRNLTQIAALRTGNTPTQMAISPDMRYLIVGNDNSQIASVFDLDTLQPSTPIRFPFGHYPRSIAVSGNAMFAAVRSAGGPHKIDRIDMGTRTAFASVQSLGAYTNEFPSKPSLAASSGWILDSDCDVGMAGPALRCELEWLYRGTERFRQAVRRSTRRRVMDFYVVGQSTYSMLRSTPIGTLEKVPPPAPGSFSSIRVAFRSNSLGESQAGMIERVNSRKGRVILPTRTTESPLTPAWRCRIHTNARRLALGKDLIVLTTSGFTVLPWNYDAAFAPPRIERVVNAADSLKTSLLDR